MSSPQGAIAVLDIDGTLVDTNYQHAIAWYRAFAHTESCFLSGVSIATSEWAAISWSGR